MWLSKLKIEVGDMLGGKRMKDSITSARYFSLPSHPHKLGSSQGEGNIHFYWQFHLLVSLFHDLSIMII